MISIILPVKNEEKFLAECLDSILDQTELNWELLAVDDHSTDNSYSILNDYSEKDSRIRVFKNEGTGIIPALKTAYKNSIGGYITRMDADDIMSRKKLELLRKGISGKPNRLATGLVKYFSEKGIGDGYKKYENWLNDLTIHSANFKEIYKECVIPSPCWMVMREDFEKCGGFNSEKYPEDYDLTFRFYGNEMEVVGIPEILHYWRDYPTRSSRTDENYADNRFLQLKLEYFLKLDYNLKTPLLIWGAGKKGKEVVRNLIRKEVEFKWISDNEKKIGKDIYGKKIFSSISIENNENPQVLILVASPKDQFDIINRLKEIGVLKYYLFC